MFARSGSRTHLVPLLRTPTYCLVERNATAVHLHGRTNRCLDFFRDLTEKEAEAAMDEFSQSDIVSIRNKSAFLMSILRHGYNSGNADSSETFCFL